MPACVLYTYVEAVVVLTAAFSFYPSHHTPIPTMICLQRILFNAAYPVERSRSISVDDSHRLSEEEATRLLSFVTPNTLEALERFEQRTSLSGSPIVSHEWYLYGVHRQDFHVTPRNEFRLVPEALGDRCLSTITCRCGAAFLCARLLEPGYHRRKLIGETNGPRQHYLSELDPVELELCTSGNDVVRRNHPLLLYVVQGGSDTFDYITRSICKEQVDWMLNHPLRLLPPGTRILQEEDF